MRLAIAIVAGLVICFSLLFAFSHLYDSPIIEDGPAYPPQVSQIPLYPIHTNKRCPQAMDEALAAVNTLRSCTDVTQCGIIVNHHLLPLMAINTSKKYAFRGLIDRLDRSCPSNIVVDWFPPHGFEYTCIDGICDVQAKPALDKQQLYKESLQMIEKANDPSDT